MVDDEAEDDEDEEQDELDGSIAVQDHSVEPPEAEPDQELEIAQVEERVDSLVGADLSTEGREVEMAEGEMDAEMSETPQDEIGRAFAQPSPTESTPEILSDQLDLDQASLGSGGEPLLVWERGVEVMVFDSD